jgi:hypothetical protein
MKKVFLIYISACCLLPIDHCFSQNFTRTDTIPVKENGSFLKMPWAGGLNYCQFSDIDMNFDGIKDLFVFDRTGHKVMTYINKGTANTVDYYDSTSKYASHFPHLEDWALLRDFNCDGKMDIFTYSNGGIQVWKNNSSAGNLQFVLQEPFLKSAYCPSVLNLSITPVDIPTIDDIDGDGDLDILAYEPSGINVQFHINQSKELGYGCDSLIFKLDCSGCWGNYRNSVNGCNVTFGSCRMMDPDSSGRHETIEDVHPGNCTLCIDLDGDGDKEVMLGQLGCCNMVMLTNGGSAASANMTAMDDSFPSYNIPAILTTFPCGYFLDLNNDNKRDLVVCPNAPNVSLDNFSIWYYLNIGTDSVPIFSRQTRSFLQKEMIDVGSGADPVFFDFNSDGLTDLLISNYIAVIDSCPAATSFGVLAFKNIGTPSSPVFDLVNSDYANLSTQLASVSSKHMTFGDIDGDGDADMYIGDYDGNIHFFRNTAASGNPANFTHIGLVTDVSTGSLIDIGNYATPQLIDVDRDGDLDLIVGERSGNLNYYKNVGSPTASSFSFITASFGGIDTYLPCCTGYSVPFMYDSAGSYRMIVSSESNRTYATTTGWLWHYKNIDGNLAGNFTLTDSLYKKIWEGSRMIANGTDINNDGSMDLVIGNYAGGVAMYLGDTSNVAVHELAQQSIEFSIYPNPSSSEVNILVSDLFRYEKPEVCIYNSIGELVFRQSLHAANTKIENRFMPGIYSCRISAKWFVKTRKFAVLK